LPLNPKCNDFDCISLLLQSAQCEVSCVRAAECLLEEPFNVAHEIVAQIPTNHKYIHFGSLKFREEPKRALSEKSVIILKMS